MNDRTVKRVASVTVLIVALLATAIVLYPHEVEVSWEGEGTVTPEGENIRFYESLDLSIEPAEGWTIGSVTINGKDAGIVGNSYSLSVSAFDFSPLKVHVIFVQDEQPEAHTVTVTSTDGGTISPSGSVEVEDGGSISFNIRPDGGYRLDFLEVDGKQVASGVGSYTLSDVRSDMKVHAVFKRNSGPGPTPQPDRYTITASASGGGSISPSGSTIVYEGGSVTFTMTPDEGHILSQLLVDGEPATVVNLKYTLSGITGDHTVHAEYVEILNRIEITSEPIMKVYTAGDTFDPTGMEVTAFYADGTSRILDPSEYSYEPSGTLGVEHTSIVVTHNGKTDSVDIRVADPDDFDVLVTHYEGTRMENGKKVNFSEYPNVPLSQFSFDTLNITPLTEQTVTMVVYNDTAMDLAANVFVADPDISEGMQLAEQLTLTVTSGTVTYTASVADITAGEVLSLGTVDAGSSVTVTVTLGFPESDQNNEAMDQKVSFGLGVIAGQEAAST